MVNKGALLAISAITIAVIGASGYFGFNPPNQEKIEQTSQADTGPTCVVGPYAFADMELGTTSLTARLENNDNDSVSPDSFRVFIGTRQQNAIELSAPSTAWLVKQTVDPGQSSSVAFNVREKWLIAPGTHRISIEATTRIGLIFTCFALIESSETLPIRIVADKLIINPNKTTTLKFTITNESDGTLSGGSICYVGQSDCPDGSTTPRFDPVPAHSSVSKQLRYNLADIEPEDWIIFALVLDVGVVYLFPALPAGSWSLPVP